MGAVPIILHVGKTSYMVETLAIIAHNGDTMKDLSGYVSWIGIAEDFLVSSSGKLATLWFDEIILQVPTPEFVKFFLYKVPGEPSDPDTLRELEKIWVPAHKYQEDYDFLSGPWKSEHNSLVEIVENVTKKEIKKESPNLSETDWAFRYDFAREGAGLLDTMKLWFDLNDKRACTFLPVWREHLVLQRLFCKLSSREPYDLFSSIINCKIPNLEAYPWERILELRHHSFFENFRRKVYELHSQIEKEGSGPAQDFVQRVIVRDMKEMVRFFRPTPNLTLCKAIVGNIPLGIPINPASILFAVKELKKEQDIAKKYGWLYFLLDIEHEVSSSNAG